MGISSTLVTTTAEHDVLTKHINFTLTTISQDWRDLFDSENHGDWQRFAFWLALNLASVVLGPLLLPGLLTDALLKTPDQQPMKAFLHCRSTNSSQTILGLCLTPQIRNEQKTSYFVEPFFVNGTARRIATHSLYDRQYMRGRRKTFSVIRTPEESHVNELSLSVLCASRTAHLKLTLVTAKPEGVMQIWRPAASSFTIPTDSLDTLPDFSAELEILADEHTIAGVHVTTHLSRRKFIRVRIHGVTLNLPGWSTFILGKGAYASSMKWHKRGFLIVRGFP